MRQAVLLRDVESADVAVFFEHQSDPRAHRMAAFAADDPSDRDAHATHWALIRAHREIVAKTVVVGGEVAGHVLHFEQYGYPSVAYWIGRRFWGKGIATRALHALLREIRQRPLYARAAKDNRASVRVLEKCGFRIIGSERAYANARGAEIDEVLLRLDEA